jgi:hypothetical protein
MSTTEEKEKLFDYKPISDDIRKPHLDVDLANLYERAIAELGLQQSKRDQIISLYLAIFSFLIPFALSQESISWFVKGCIFVITGLVGVLFALIIVRYRIYKEAYWLCCQSLTALTAIQAEKLNKDVVQNTYYETLYKKGKGFFQEGTETFCKALYVKKNLFSAETMHFMIHAMITVIILGLGTFLMLELQFWLRLGIAVLVALLVAFLLLRKYFAECIKIYQVLIDHKDASFNHTFKIAWFLHFYT